MWVRPWGGVRRGHSVFELSLQRPALSDLAVCKAGVGDGHLARRCGLRQRAPEARLGSGTRERTPQAGPGAAQEKPRLEEAAPARGGGTKAAAPDALMEKPGGGGGRTPAAAWGCHGPAAPPLPPRSRAGPTQCSGPGRRVAAHGGRAHAAGSGAQAAGLNPDAQQRAGRRPQVRGQAAPGQLGPFLAPPRPAPEFPARAGRVRPGLVKLAGRVFLSMHKG